MEMEKEMDMIMTPEQLRRLVELAYLGEWVVNSRHGVDFQDDEAVEALQGLLALASSLTSGIERDVETGQYYLEQEWSDAVQDRYLADYDDHVFWDELVERLAERDLARNRDVEAEEIDRDEDIAELKPLEKYYYDELERNGLDRLGIVE